MGISQIQQLRDELNHRFSLLDERLEEMRSESADNRKDIVDIRTDIADIRKEIRESNEDMKRHFDVVTERTHSYIQLVIEQLRSERTSRESLALRVEHLEDFEVLTRNRLALLEKERR